MVRLLTSLDRKPGRTGAAPSAEFVCSVGEESGPDIAVHPGRAATPDEILVHLLAFHHPQLGDQLLGIASLLQMNAAPDVERPSECNAIRNLFADLHYDLVACLLRERYVLYPRISRFAGGDRSVASELVGVTRLIEHAHACVLQKLWRLMELTSRGMPAAWRVKTQRRAANGIVQPARQLLPAFV